MNTSCTNKVNATRKQGLSAQSVLPKFGVLQFCKSKAGKCPAILSLLLLIASLTVNCAKLPQPEPAPGQTQSIRTYKQPADYYLERASDNSNKPQQQAYALKAAGRLIQDGMEERARQIISDINPQALSGDLYQDQILLRSHLALLNQQPRQAIKHLSQLSPVSSLSQTQQAEYHNLLANAYDNLGEYWPSAEEYIKLAPLLADNTIRPLIQRKIWANLLQLAPQELPALAPGQSSNAWLALITIKNHYADNWALMQQEIKRWQAQYPDHPVNAMLTANGPAASALDLPPQQIALLLPSQGPLAGPGNAIRAGFMAAYYQAIQDQDRQTTMRFYDTSNNDKITALYQQAVNDGADFVIGPLDKARAQTLASSRVIAVPTIILNYTEAHTAPVTNLYQFGLSLNNEARQIANKAWQDGHRRALIIIPDSQWGQSIATTYREQWQHLGGTIVEQLAYTEKQDLNAAIKALLHVTQSEERSQQLENTIRKNIKFIPRRRQDADLIFLIAFPEQARQIYPLIKYYYAGDLPVYAPSVIYSGTPDPMKDNDLNGIIFSEIPLVLNKNNQLQQNYWQEAGMPLNIHDYARLYALGFDAYNLTGALNQLVLFADLGIKGNTGMLYLNKQQQIERQLQWAQFKNGQANKK